MSFDAVMPPYNSSDPTASFLSSSALDFLLIELVPLAYRVTNEMPVALQPPAENSAVTNNGPMTASPSRAEDDEALDAVRHKLETAGYRVGQGLVERYRPTSEAWCRMQP